MERAVALAGGQRISPESLPDRIRTHAQHGVAAPAPQNGNGTVLPKEVGTLWGEDDVTFLAALGFANGDATGVVIEIMDLKPG